MFHNVRLPVDVEKGAQGGPSFRTNIISLTSGFEQRNIDWSAARGQWDLSYGMDTKANHEAVLAFFYGRRGRAYGFRFKDWTDYQIGTAGTPQTIGTGNGVTTTFQIYRRYAGTVTTFDRKITRIVASTTSVYVNSVLQASGWAVNNDTGIITFDVAPADTLAVAVICEFDVPVRFNTDSLVLNAMRDDAFTIPEVPIVEIRE